MKWYHRYKSKKGEKALMDDYEMREIEMGFLVSRDCGRGGVKRFALFKNLFEFMEWVKTVSKGNRNSVLNLVRN
jgi:hypothetical protein